MSSQSSHDAASLEVITEQGGDMDVAASTEPVAGCHPANAAWKGETRIPYAEPRFAGAAATERREGEVRKGFADERRPQP